MKKLIILYSIFISSFSIGQNSEDWKDTLTFSKSFKVKYNKNKIPQTLIKSLFDTITHLANPKEQVYGCTGGQPKKQLNWYAVDKNDNYIIFITSYGYSNKNWYFLVNKKTLDKAIIVKGLKTKLSFDEFKLIYLHQNIEIEKWTGW